MSEATNASEIELTEEDRERYAQIIDDIFCQLENDARNNSPLKDYSKRSKKLWKQWRPRFFGLGTPLLSSKHIDSLCYRFGIYGYEEHLSTTYPSTSPLLWFEEFPTMDKTGVRASKIAKKLKRSKKFARKYKKLEKRYSKVARFYKTKYKTPDYLEADALEREIKKRGFNPQELWNLDWVLPILMYVRIADFAQLKAGYPAYFKTWDDYNETVLQPILNGLEMQIVMNYEPVFSPVLNAYTKDFERDDMLMFYEVLNERIDKCYALLAEYMSSFWW